MSGSVAHERIWTFYLVTVGAMVGLSLSMGTGRCEGPLTFLAIHAGLLCLVPVVPRLGRSRMERAIARGAFSTIGLFTVFSSLSLVLPCVNPEPYEFTWISADRALFGCDPTVAAQALLWPPFVEVLQLCYASFYFVPMVVVLGASWRGGLGVFERGLDLVVLGFALSYLGYMLWPTLPPYRFLEHDVPLRGVFAAEWLHAVLNEAEFHKWNCFPSGHTMLSVLSLAIAWRHARRLFWALLPVVSLLVLSTVVLRYHYVVDVIAGLAGVPLTLWLGRRVRGDG